jgi:hydrogenase small subunit
LSTSGLFGPEEAQAAIGALPVVWFQCQACTGCSVSLLNSINYLTIDTLLTQTIDLEYHTTVMAAAGQPAVNQANTALGKGGFVLVVEGAIPTGAMGNYCTLWPGMTAQKAVTTFAARAAYVLAVGTCASFGGIPAGKPNPTGAVPASQLAGRTPVVNLPGCPAHPDWIVGTVAYILANGGPPALDANKRPTTYYGTPVHNACSQLADFTSKYSRNMNHSGGRSCMTCHANTDTHVPGAPHLLGKAGCLFPLGCRGRTTGCDCSTRKWNSPAANTVGVNWCVDAGAPCTGCTEPSYPDGMSPFYTLNGSGAEDD